MLPAAGFIHLPHHPFYDGIVHIHQKHTKPGTSVVCQFHRTAQGNDPIVPEGPVVKEILYMRRGKMHVFHFLLSLLIPALPGNIGVFFLQYHRLCRHQAPVFIVNGHTVQILPIRPIQKVHSLLNFLKLPGKILFFNHIIVNGIRHPAHTDQIILQIFSCLLHQLLCSRYNFLTGRS